jgi:hypothetical protein
VRGHAFEGVIHEETIHSQRIRRAGLQVLQETAEEKPIAQIAQGDGVLQML